MYFLRLSRRVSRYITHNLQALAVVTPSRYTTIFFFHLGFILASSLLHLPSSSLIFRKPGWSSTSTAHLRLTPFGAAAELSRSTSEVQAKEKRSRGGALAQAIFSLSGLFYSPGVFRESKFSKPPEGAAIKSFGAERAGKDVVIATSVKCKGAEQN